MIARHDVRVLGTTMHYQDVGSGAVIDADAVRRAWTQSSHPVAAQHTRSGACRVNVETDWRVGCLCWALSMALVS